MTRIPIFQLLCEKGEKQAASGCWMLFAVVLQSEGTALHQQLTRDEMRCKILISWAEDTPTLANVMKSATP